MNVGVPYTRYRIWRSL